MSSPGIQTPPFIAQLPSPSVQMSSPGIQVPSSTAQLPSPGVLLPSSGVQVPSLSIQISSPGIQVPISSAQLLSPGVQDASSKSLVLSQCRQLSASLFQSLAVERHSVQILRFRQVIGAIGPLCNNVIVGTTSGFSAVLLPQLAQESSKIKIESHDISWIASIAVLAMIAGCLVSGHLVEQYGRRPLQLLISIVSVIGWVIISFASKLWMIYTGRIVTGFCSGLVGPASIIYIAETTDPGIRGVLLAGLAVAFSGGVLCSHGLGALFHWKLAAVLCSIFQFVAYILLIFTPESPVWLVRKGKLSKAEEAFRWLRGYSDSATEEMMVILKKKDTLSLSKSKFNMEFLEQILDPSFVKPFLICIVFFFIQQASGVNAVVFYSVSILSDVTSILNGHLSTFIIDIVRVFMSVIVCILLRKVPRRVLAVTSATGAAISLFVLAFSIKYLPPHYYWISLSSFIAYICFISIGIVPLPWIMIGEVFPLSLRELGSGISSTFGYFIFFCVVKTAPYLTSMWDVTGAFTAYATVAFFGAIFLYFFLPETKKKALHEIENGFRRKIPKM